MALPPRVKRSFFTMSKFLPKLTPKSAVVRTSRPVTASTKGITPALAIGAGIAGTVGLAAPHTTVRVKTYY